MLGPIRVPVARVLYRIQPLDKLVAATVCYLLRKDFAVDAEPLKSLFHESSAEGLKWFLSYRKPLMTILIPVYNIDPEALKKSIESVLCQAYKK
jgi:cellulose synthase/poly-beta-1,6-N-acetylglucosamine synthase-like glycosyltransferase